MTKRKLFATRAISFLVLLFVPELAFALTHALGIDEAFKSALKRSEVVQDQAELVLQADENYNQAIGGILPTINASTYYFQQEATQGFAFSTPTQKQLKFTAEQPVFRGFREYAGVSETKLLTKAQRQSQKLSVVQLYQQVASDFFQVLAAEKDVSDLETESGYYKKRIDELNARVRIGRSRPAEVTQIQSSLESLYATLEASKDQLSTARKTFAFLTGLPDNTLITDPYPADFNPTIEALDKYLPTIERRPEIEGYKLRRDAADDAINVAKGAHLPSVDLTGDYYAYRSGGLPGGSWDFQLTLTLPIYAGGTIQSKVRQAASQYRENELSLSRGERLADQEIRTYHSRVQLDHAQVATLQKAKDFAWTNFQQETRDYRLGLVTNLDVLTSLTSFEEAERSLDRAKFQEKADYLYLLSATGKVSDPEVAF